MKTFFRISLLVLLLVSAGNIAAQTRPVVGISCTWSPERISVSTAYVEAVEKAGGLPVLIPLSADAETLRAQVARIDALIMTGGEDYDPLLYGEEPVPALEDVNRDRDAYDLALIRLALARGIPLLGICRGEQGMNVAAGGTLWQDLPSQYDAPVVKHRQQMNMHYGSHTVIVERGTRLHDILQRDTLAVNTLHHQAVKALAPGWRATAHTADGVVEAIELPGDTFAVGVQWHPEAMAQGGDSVMAKLFRALVREAAARMAE